jgi:hypothetical protein
MADKLRRYKPQPIIFEPSDAYIIVGHGKNSDSTFIVPDNCIVVVKARPGEAIHSKSLYPYLNKIVNPENADIMRDPLHHTRELIEKLDDFVLYKPGDKCPNFIYRMFSFDDINMGTANRFGLIKAPILEPIRELHSKKTKILDIIKGDFKSTITNMYSDSVYPTTDAILKSIYKQFPSLSENPTIGEVRSKESERWDENVERTGKNDSPSPVEDEFIITQEELCKQYKGVFYNFVCRGISGIYYGKFPLPMGEFNIVNNVTNLRKAKPLVRNVLKNRIGNAETKRKQLLRNTKYNRPSEGGGSRKRKTRRRNNRP